MQKNCNGAFASILIGATLLMFVALLGHPAAGGGHRSSGRDALDLLYAARVHLGVMHAAAIGLELVVLTCVIAFCKLLGFDRPLVAFAAVGFSSATAAVCVAASFDGFLIPSFAAPHIGLGDGTPLDLRALIAGGALTIQYATKLGIALMASSAFCLSLQLVVMRELRAVAVTGIFLALAQIGALVTIPMLTPRNVAFAALPVLVWQLAVGIAWARSGYTTGDAGR